MSADFDHNPSKAVETDGSEKSTNLPVQAYNTRSEIQLTRIDGASLVRKMAEDVEVMMQHKVNAIKRIMDLAENIALDHNYDKDLGKNLLLREGSYSYFSSKKQLVNGGISQECRPLSALDCGAFTCSKMDEEESKQLCYPQMTVTNNEHFSGTSVNLSHSSVHVPTDVFDGASEVINAISWSSKLEDTFKDNYRRDPSLSWQYFGSSTGFLRQVTPPPHQHLQCGSCTFYCTCTFTTPAPVPGDGLAHGQGRPGHV